MCDDIIRIAIFYNTCVFIREGQFIKAWWRAKVPKRESIDRNHYANSNNIPRRTNSINIISFSYIERELYIETHLES
jgi:hypothetical protein